MTISITVTRSPSDNRGPDIVNPLITTVQQALNVGTLAVDDNCSNRMGVSGSMPLHEHMVPGKVARITDSEIGQYNSFLVSYDTEITMSGTEQTAITSVELEKIL